MLHTAMEQKEPYSLLDKIEEACFSLNNMPERGKVPEELKSIGINDYLQIICFSYRIIYQIESERVFVHAVLDGRRDMLSLSKKVYL
jgi:toxin ParE1/3/4